MWQTKKSSMILQKKLAVQSYQDRQWSGVTVLEQNTMKRNNKSSEGEEPLLNYCLSLWYNTDLIYGTPTQTLY